MSQPNQTPAPSARALIPMDSIPCDQNGNLVPQHGGHLEALAQRLCNSPLVNAKIRGNELACTALMAMGAELGFSPAMSLTVIDPIEQPDGSVKLRVTGEGYLAVMQQAALAECENGLEHGFAGKPYEDDFHCWIRTKRKGQAEQVTTFSVADAKTAGLWGKRTFKGNATNWVLYPKDMLFWKAVARHGRRCWTARMKGFALREDHADHDEDRVGPDRARNVTPVVQRAQLRLDGTPDVPAPAGLLELRGDPIFGSDTYDVIGGQSPVGGDREQPAGEASAPSEGGGEGSAPPVGSQEEEVNQQLSPSLEQQAGLDELSPMLDRRAEQLVEALGGDYAAVRAAIKAQVMAGAGVEPGIYPTLEQIQTMKRLAPNATAAKE